MISSHDVNSACERSMDAEIPIIDSKQRTNSFNVEWN